MVSVWDSVVRVPEEPPPTFLRKSGGVLKEKSQDSTEKAKKKAKLAFFALARNASK
jgi:hypothetical protein